MGRLVPDQVTVKHEIDVTVSGLEPLKPIITTVLLYLLISKRLSRKETYVVLP